MNELEKIKLKIHELNVKSNKAFEEFKLSDLVIEKSKHLKSSLEHAEESYKAIKGLRNVPSDVFDYDLCKLRLEYNLFGLYLLSNRRNDAKKCLDKFRYNPKLKDSDRFKQRKLVILCINLSIYYASANKADLDSFDRLTECFSFIMELFFNAFENKDENYVKLFKQLISILVYIVNNDKDNIKNYADYAKQIVDHRDVDDKLDIDFAKLFSDLGLHFAAFDYDISKSLFNRSLKILSRDESSKGPDVIFSIINNNLIAAYNRYKQIKEATALIDVSHGILKRKSEEKKNNKFLKFQLSDCCFNLGYTYAKYAEIENAEENYKKAKDFFWLSFSEAKDIAYASNQYESLEAIATIDLQKSDLLNSLEYFNMSLKIYNKSTGSQFPDEINRRLNNKIKLIQTKLNEINLREFLNKKKDDEDQSRDDDDDDESEIKDKNDKNKLISGFEEDLSLNKLKSTISALNKLNSLEKRLSEPINNDTNSTKHKQEEQKAPIDDDKRNMNFVKKSVTFTNAKPDVPDMKNENEIKTTAASSSVKSSTDTTSGTTDGDKSWETLTDDDASTESSATQDSKSNTTDNSPKHESSTITKSNTTATSSNHDSKSNTTESSSNRDLNTTDTSSKRDSKSGATTTTESSSSIRDSKSTGGSSTNSERSKKKPEEAFDKSKYESAIQQLVSKSLVRKQPEIPILYSDFNKGKVPKRIPNESNSSVCIIT